MSGARALGALLGHLLNNLELLSQSSMTIPSPADVTTSFPTTTVTTTMTMETTSTTTLSNLPAFASAARDLVSNNAATSAVLAALSEQANSLGDFAHMIQETQAWQTLTYPLQFEWVAEMLKILSASVLVLLLLQFGGFLAFMLFETGDNAAAPAPAPSIVTTGAADAAGHGTAPAPYTAEVSNAEVIEAAGNGNDDNGTGNTDARDDIAGNAAGIDATAIETRITQLEVAVREAIDTATQAEGSNDKTQRQTISVLGRVLNDVQRLREQSGAQMTSVQALADEFAAMSGKTPSRAFEKIFTIIQQLVGSVEASRKDTQQAVDRQIEDHLSGFQRQIDEALDDARTSQRVTQNVDRRFKTTIEKFRQQVTEKLQILQKEIQSRGISDEERASILQDLAANIEIEEMLKDLKADIRKEFKTELERVRCSCSVSSQADEDKLNERFEAASEEVDGKIKDITKKFGDQLEQFRSTLPSSGSVDNALLDQRFIAASKEVDAQLENTVKKLEAQLEEARCKCSLSTTTNEATIDDRVAALQAKLESKFAADMKALEAKNVSSVRQLFDILMTQMRDQLQQQLDVMQDQLQQQFDDFEERLGDMEQGVDHFVREATEERTRQDAATALQFQASTQAFASIERELQRLDGSIAQTNGHVNSLTERQREMDQQGDDANALVTVQEHVQTLNEGQNTMGQMVDRLNASTETVRNNLTWLQHNTVTHEDLATIQTTINELAEELDALQSAQQQIQQNLQQHPQQHQVQAPQAEAPWATGWQQNVEMSPQPAQQPIQQQFDQPEIDRPQEATQWGWQQSSGLSPPPPAWPGEDTGEQLPDAPGWPQPPAWPTENTGLMLPPPRPQSSRPEDVVLIDAPSQPEAWSTTDTDQMMTSEQPQQPLRPEDVELPDAAPSPPVGPTASTGEMYPAPAPQPPVWPAVKTGQMLPPPRPQPPVRPVVNTGQMLPPTRLQTPPWPVVSTGERPGTPIPYSSETSVVNTGERPGTPVPFIPPWPAVNRPVLSTNTGGQEHAPRPSPIRESEASSEVVPPPPADNNDDDFLWLLGNDSDDGNNNGPTQGQGTAGTTQAPQGTTAHSGMSTRRRPVPTAIDIMPNTAGRPEGQEYLDPPGSALTPNPASRPVPRVAHSRRQRYSQAGDLPTLPAPSAIGVQHEMPAPPPPTPGFAFPRDVPSALLGSNDPTSPQQTGVFQFDPDALGMPEGTITFQHSTDTAAAAAGLLPTLRPSASQSAAQGEQREEEQEKPESDVSEAS